MGVVRAAFPQDRELQDVMFPLPAAVATKSDDTPVEEAESVTSVLPAEG
ncbi:hypothetical protein KEG38_53805 [Polyangium jinanense]|nr:hypothetical protein [Polyangium jinanense]MDC3962802.1 hypothetical protein [Polyangium jinanense]